MHQWKTLVAGFRIRSQLGLQHQCRGVHNASAPAVPLGRGRPIPDTPLGASTSGLYHGVDVPIKRHRKQICQSVRSSRYTIVQGHRGVGKSVSLPTVIHDDVVSRGQPAQIVCVHSTVGAARCIASQTHELLQDSRVKCVTTALQWPAVPRGVIHTTAVVLLEVLRTLGTTEATCQPPTHVLIDNTELLGQTAEVELLVARLRLLVSACGLDIKVVYIFDQPYTDVLVSHVADQLSPIARLRDAFGIDAADVHVVKRTDVADNASSVLPAGVHFADEILHLLGSLHPDDIDFWKTRVTRSSNVVDFYYLRPDVTPNTLHVISALLLSMGATRGTVLVHCPNKATVHHVEHCLNSLTFEVMPLELHCLDLLDDDNSAACIKSTLGEGSDGFRYIITCDSGSAAWLGLRDVVLAVDFCCHEVMSPEGMVPHSLVNRSRHEIGTQAHYPVVMLITRSVFASLPEYPCGSMFSDGGRHHPIRAALTISRFFPTAPIDQVVEALPVSGVSSSIRWDSVVQECNFLGYSRQRSTNGIVVTNFGRFCLALPVALQLGRLVWFGLLFGAAADALALAAHLTSPRLNHHRVEYGTTFPSQLLAFHDGIFTTDPTVREGDIIPNFDAYRQWLRKIAFNTSAFDPTAFVLADYLLGDLCSLIGRKINRCRWKTDIAHVGYMLGLADRRFLATREGFASSELLRAAWVAAFGSLLVFPVQHPRGNAAAVLQLSGFNVRTTALVPLDNSMSIEAASTAVDSVQVRNLVGYDRHAFITVGHKSYLAVNLGDRCRMLGTGVSNPDDTATDTKALAKRLLRLSILAQKVITVHIFEHAPLEHEALGLGVVSAPGRRVRRTCRARGHRDVDVSVPPEQTSTGEDDDDQLLHEAVLVYPQLRDLLPSQSSAPSAPMTSTATDTDIKEEDVTLLTDAPEESGDSVNNTAGGRLWLPRGRRCRISDVVPVPMTSWYTAQPAVAVAEVQPTEWCAACGIFVRRSLFVSHLHSSVHKRLLQVFCRALVKRNPEADNLSAFKSGESRAPPPLAKTVMDSHEAHQRLIRSQPTTRDAAVACSTVTTGANQRIVRSQCWMIDFRTWDSIKHLVVGLGVGGADVVGKLRLLTNTRTMEVKAVAHSRTGVLHGDGTLQPRCVLRLLGIADAVGQIAVSDLWEPDRGSDPIVDSDTVVRRIRADLHADPHITIQRSQQPGLWVYIDAGTYVRCVEDPRLHQLASESGKPIVEVIPSLEDHRCSEWNIPASIVAANCGESATRDAMLNAAIVRTAYDAVLANRTTESTGAFMTRLATRLQQVTQPDSHPVVVVRDYYSKLGYVCLADLLAEGLGCMFVDSPGADGERFLVPRVLPSAVIPRR